MIEYKDTSSKELRLAFAREDLDVTNLDIIDKKVIGDFECGILGASHYIKFIKDGRVLFTEVFSCAEFSSENTSILQVKDTVSAKLEQSFGNVSYQFSSHIIDYTQEMYSDYMRLYEIETDKALLFEFPYDGDPEFTPVTLIIYTKHHDAVRFDTLHAYPEENKLVLTKTVINEKD